MSGGVLNVYLITLTFFILTWTAVPMIPRYVMVLGGDPVTIGYVMSAAPFITAITRVVFSVISETRSRVFMMRLGMLLLGISYMVMYVSTDITLVLIGRLIQGLSLASFIPPSIAYVVDVARRGTVGRALGTRALMASLGYTVGPFLGGLIAEYLGYRTLFLITSLSALLASTIIRLEDVNRGTTTFYGALVEVTKLIKQRVFLLIFNSTVLQTIILASVIPFLSSYMKVSGYSDYEAGIVASAYGIAGLFSRLLMNFFTDKNLIMLALLGLGLNALGLITLSYHPFPPLSAIPVLLIGFGDGLFVPVAQALVFINTNTTLRCVTSGLYATSWDIGMLIGPIIAGYLVTISSSYLVMFRSLIVFTVASTIILLLVSKSFIWGIVREH